MVLIMYSEGRILFCSNNQLIVRTINDGENKAISLPHPHVPEKQEEGKVIETVNPNISCLAVSKDHQFIAVSTDAKQVVVFDKNFSVLRNFIVSRISSKICFTPRNSLIVADKTGDVYLYNLECDEVTPILLLGHLSVVLDVLVTDCGKYVITCDRDEKVRVSKFPNAYNIQSFCLGHTEFVISLNIVGTKLVSGSGDGTIRFWNYITGEQLGIVNTNEHINEEHINQFCDGMNSEDIEVSALPITDMQIYSSDTYLFIGVSLFQYKKLLLYSIDSKSLQVNFCKHIYVGFPFSFCLSNELFIFTSLKIVCFELQKYNYKENIYKNVSFPDVNYFSFTSDQNISVLYKKRFDNVGDYIERKKARLELK